METKRNINVEIATSAQTLKKQLRNYHNLLIEKYTIDKSKSQGSIHRLYDYIDVIDQLNDLLDNPNPFDDVL